MVSQCVIYTGCLAIKHHVGVIVCYQLQVDLIAFFCMFLNRGFQNEGPTICSINPRCEGILLCTIKMIFRLLCIYTVIPIEVIRTLSVRLNVEVVGIFTCKLCEYITVNSALIVLNISYCGHFSFRNAVEAVECCYVYELEDLFFSAFQHYFIGNCAQVNKGFCSPGIIVVEGKTVWFIEDVISVVQNNIYSTLTSCKRAKCFSLINFREFKCRFGNFLPFFIVLC